MKLLAIETAFEPCSVALWLDGESTQRFELAPRGHASLVLPFVEELLAEAGLGLGSLDALAFSRGPGSFTSLRIGISVAQGLAWGADLPVAPVSSLLATAQAAANGGVRRALVAMDARMDQVFTGRFQRRDGLMREAGEEAVCDPADVVRPDSPGWSGVGNGFGRYPVLAAMEADLVSLHASAWPSAADVALLAADWLRTNQPLAAELAQPVYLRDKVAEKAAT